MEVRAVTPVWGAGIGALLVVVAAYAHGQDDGPAALEEAVGDGDAAAVETLIDAGADVRDPELLLSAVVKGGIEVLGLLLDAGADVNASLAIPPEQEEGVEEIFGASVEVVAATPLSVAALMGRLEAAEFLLQRGADPNVVTAVGLPVGLAATRGHVDVVRLLIESGGDPSGRPLAGAAAIMFSPLLGAAKSGHVDVAALLLESGGYPCPDPGSFRMGDIVFRATLNVALQEAGSDEITALADRAQEACPE